MAKNRRTFLKIIGVAAGGALVAGGVFFQRAKSAAADWYRRLVELDRSQPGGELSEAELKSLTAAAVALLGEKIDVARYRDFFQWKAANAGGYLGVYRSFAAAIDQAAREAGAAAFDSADRTAQQRVLERAAAVRRMINEDDKAAGLRFALFDRQWLLFERYVIRELLTLFSRTDAWLISGYGPHPGVPRGLAAYQQPPEGVQP